MVFFGHLGIGSTLVHPWTRNLRKLKWVFLGTLLPDLIDKPLYYGLSWLTGKSGAELGAATGLISGTRTLGHTAIFLMALALLCFAKKSKTLAALVLGVVSHLVLDGCTAAIMGDPKHEFFQVVLWPYPNGLFPAYSYENLKDHLSFWQRPFLLYSELVGAALLLTRFRKKAR